MKLDINLLRQYEIDKKLISSRHDSLPLTIWNYSRLTAYDKSWDDITINCRGLVTDDSGNIIAKSFPKFFNWEEYTDPLIQKVQPINWKVHHNELDIYTKEDGSLGIMFMYNNEWVFASRGSFRSEQAIWFKEYANDNFNFNKIPRTPNYTYLFELIFKENRIVLDYKGESKAVLLGITNNQTGRDIALKSTKLTDSFEHVVKPLPLLVDKEFKDLNEFLLDLKSKDIQNEEGYVICWPDGKRVKIKFENYIKLHWLLSDINSCKIWECYKDNTINDFLEAVPDECYNKITDYLNILKKSYKDFIMKHIRHRDEIIWNLDSNASDFNKQYALRVNSLLSGKANISAGVLYKLRDFKGAGAQVPEDIRQLAIKNIKPERINIL